MDDWSMTGHGRLRLRRGESLDRKAPRIREIGTARGVVQTAGMLHGLMRPEGRYTRIDIRGYS